MTVPVWDKLRAERMIEPHAGLRSVMLTMTFITTATLAGWLLLLLGDDWFASVMVGYLWMLLELVAIPLCLAGIAFRFPRTAIVCLGLVVGVPGLMILGVVLFV